MKSLPVSRRSWVAELCSPELLERVAAWYLSSLLVFAGVWFGGDYLPRRSQPHQLGVGFLHNLANWDGEWYRRILLEGYSYEPHLHSTVAFFPAYPLAGRAIVGLTGCAPEMALLCVTHLCLLAIVWLFPKYVAIASRANPSADQGGLPPSLSFPHADGLTRLEGVDVGIPARRLADSVLLAFLLWPMTLFFRVAYTEAPFMLLLLLAYHGMQRKWPAWVLAALTGLATATRAPGIALVPPVLWHLCANSKTKIGQLSRCLLWTPCCCWGLLAFMGFQWFQFGDALAFVRTQQHWAQRHQPNLWERIPLLLTLRPFLDVYDSRSEAYWEYHEQHVQNPLFSLEFANPIWFLSAVAILIYGYRRGWIGRSELALSAGLLLIPYVAHSYRMCAQGFGRISSVAFPLYIVMGQIVYRLPTLLLNLICALSAALLMAYSALFASWHLII